MRGVSRGVRRSAVLFALLAIFMADGAAAKGRRQEGGWRQQFARAKHFIVTVLGRFSNPPGDPIVTILGRFSHPPGQPVDDDTTLKASGDPTRQPE